MTLIQMNVSGKQRLKKKRKKERQSEMGLDNKNPDKHRKPMPYNRR